MSMKNALRATLIAGAIAGSLGAAGAGTALASTTDPTLHASVVSDYKADCSYSADLTWDRASNHLTGRIDVDNHLWFAACRKSADVTFTDDDGVPHDATIVIDTAVAKTDPTAPSRVTKFVDLAPAVGRHDAPFIDHMSVNLVDRLSGR